MQQETLDPGVGIKLRNLHAIAFLTVTKGEANVIALDVEEAMVGNGHPVGLAAQITQGLLRAAKRGFSIDDPLLAAQALDEGVECLGRLQL